MEAKEFYGIRKPEAAEENWKWRSAIYQIANDQA
jgi:hypothetical protein